jgi:hypothetical protein
MDARRMEMNWRKALVTATVSTCEVKGQTRWTKACGCASPAPSKTRKNGEKMW